MTGLVHRWHSVAVLIKGALEASGCSAARRAAAGGRLGADREGVHFAHNALMALGPVAVIKPSR
jgi:hypothetical protein